MLHVTSTATVTMLQMNVNVPYERRMRKYIVVV